MDFDLAGWLNSEVGLEEPVIRRRNLFLKLRRLYDKHGVQVLRIIASSWEFALERAGPAKVKRCFCRVVKLRLQEAKLWDEERKYDAMSIGDIISSGIFKSRAPQPLFDEPRGPKPRTPEGISLMEQLREHAQRNGYADK